MAVYLSLGSNLGDREANLRRAIESIAANPANAVLAVSSIYETAPVGEPNQPCFLNLAAAVETNLAPHAFLEQIQTIELAMGRVRTRRWGPREIDIDIILWGTRIIDSPTLTIPHPEFRNRAFVLAPLAEIAPDAVDPITGRTVRDLHNAPGVQGELLPYRQT